MMMSVDVDTEAYKALGARRESEDEPLNAVIRRLLGLPKEISEVRTADLPGPRGIDTGRARPRQVPEGGDVARIGVFGATGSIGGKVVEEARRRGIAVAALARVPAKLAPADGVTALAADASDAAAVAKAAEGLDVLVVSLKWPGVDVGALVEGVRQAGVGRTIFVLGNGTSLREDGRRQFHHAADAQGVPPPPTVPALRVLDALRAKQEVNWSAIVCPIDIKAGERTEQFRVGDEHLIFDADGKSAISEEDFAVAILDEVQAPRHERQQFCVAY